MNLKLPTTFERSHKTSFFARNFRDFDVFQSHISPYLSAHIVFFFIEKVSAFRVFELSLWAFIVFLLRHLGFLFLFSVCTTRMLFRYPRFIGLLDLVIDTDTCVYVRIFCCHVELKRDSNPLQFIENVLKYR